MAELELTSETVRVRPYGRLGACLIATLSLLHVLYLLSPWSIGLTGDEAYYWDWSRQLDYHYFSKPPMVAWLIAASCRLLGDTMLAVRLPAIVLGAGSLTFAYLLAKRLFGSRTAMVTLLLMCSTPLLNAGSILMTVDATLFFFLSAATYFAARAVLDNSPKWWWLVALAMVGAMLAKPSAGLWLVGLYVFLVTGVAERRWLRDWPAYLPVLAFLLGLVPMVVWNASHGWVTTSHIAGDLAGRETPFIGELGLFLGGQAAVILPPLFIVMVMAVVNCFRRPTRERRLLVYGALIMFICPALVSVVGKTQANWTAPAYLGLCILAADYILSVSSRPRSWCYAIGLTAVPAVLYAHFAQVSYYAAAHLRELGSCEAEAASIDPGRRGRGWEEMGQAIGRHLESCRDGAIIMAPSYQMTALASFYTPGQPRTYRFLPYVNAETRWTQYEMWPDRRLDELELIGRDAVLVMSKPETGLGYFFDSLELAEKLEHRIAGEVARETYIYVGRGFKGMQMQSTRPTH